MFPLTFIFKFDVTYSQLKKKTKKTQNNRYIFVLEAESIKIKEYFLIHSLILSNFYFSKDCNSHCAYSRLKVIFILVLVFFLFSGHITFSCYTFLFSVNSCCSYDGETMCVLSKSIYFETIVY